MQSMIGEIKEKSARAPRPLPIICKNPVTPSILPSVVPAKSFNANLSIDYHGSSKVLNTVNGASAESDENTRMIDSMTPEEIQAALEEVSSLLSAKNIAFLKGLSKSGEASLPKFSSSSSVQFDLAAEKPPVPPSAKSKALPLGIHNHDSSNEEEEILTDFSPRFDLQGRRVIVKAGLVSEISSFLSAYYKADLEAVHSTAESLVESVITSGIVFSFVSREDSAALELFNHEFSPDSPGYNLREICERSIAVKMIKGILQIRDCIVSLVPYCTLDGSALQGVTTSSSTLKKFNDLCAHIMHPLKLLARMQPISSNTSYPNMLALLVDLLLRFCGAEKLPPELPSLLLWSFELKNTPSQQLYCLTATQYYLTSEVEAAVKATAIDWQGLWGAYGTPPLLTPHSKRHTGGGMVNGGSSIVSYEKHHMECLEKAQPVDEDGDNANTVQYEQTNNEIQNKFVLQCRWNRVEAFFSNNDFVTKIVSLSTQCTKQLLLKVVNSTTNTFLNATESVDFHSGRLCVELLTLAPSALSGSGSSAVLLVLSRKILLMLLPVLVDLERSVWLARETLPQMLLSASCDHLAAWWKLLCEYCRWSPGFTLSLFTDDHQLSVFQHLMQWPTTSLNMWSLRLARLSLIQDGVGLTSEVLTSTLSVDHISQLKDKQLSVEWLNWLEQCAITASQWLIGFSHNTITKSHHNAISASLLGNVCSLLLNQFEYVAYWLSALDKTVDLIPSHSAACQFLLSVCGGIGNDSSDSITTVSSLFTAAVLHTEVRGQALAPALSMSCHADLENIDWRSPFQRVQQILSETRYAHQLRLYLESNRNLHSETSIETLHLIELSITMQRLEQCPLMTSESTSFSVVWQSFHSSVHSSLSTGLLVWQMNRLRQVSLLLDMQHTAVHNVNILLPRFLSAVGSFTDSMSGIASYLLNAYLHCVLQSSCNSDMLSQQLDDLRASLLTAITGVTLPAPQFNSLIKNSATRFGSYGALLGQPVPPSSKVFPCHWLLNCFTDHFPLTLHWQYSCLSQLSGSTLIHWLQHLRLQQQNVDCYTVDGLGTSMYYLLKLTTEENAVKWLDETDDTLLTASGLSDTAAQTYSGLLSSMLQRISASTTNEAFVAELCVVAKQNHFSVPSLNGKRTLKQSSAASGLSGLLDLTTKLCDGALSQAVHLEVHCAALCVLLHPSIPVLVRTKVWKQLSELRLLHLLECERMWKDSLFMNIFGEDFGTTPNRSEIACLRVMLTGVCTLRGAEDRRWNVVSVIVYQLARILLSQSVVKSSEPTGALLLNIICNNLEDENRRAVEVPDWLVADMLIYSTGAQLSEYHSARVATTDPKIVLQKALQNIALEVVFADESKSIRRLIADHRTHLL